VRVVAVHGTLGVLRIESGALAEATIVPVT
jgi:hypothetical protein